MRGHREDKYEAFRNSRARLGAGFGHARLHHNANTICCGNRNAQDRHLSRRRSTLRTRCLAVRRTWPALRTQISPRRCDRVIRGHFRRQLGHARRPHRLLQWRAVGRIGRDPAIHHGPEWRRPPDASCLVSRLRLLPALHALFRRHVGFRRGGRLSRRPRDRRKSAARREGDRRPARDALRR